MNCVVPVPTAAGIVAVELPEKGKVAAVQEALLNATTFVPVQLRVIFVLTTAEVGVGGELKTTEALVASPMVSINQSGEV